MVCAGGSIALALLKQATRTNRTLPTEGSKSTDSELFFYCSILRTPPAPSSLPGTRKYSFEVPKEGEEFYFAVLR